MVELAFWKEAGEMGLLGVSVPEEYGGHGGDFRHDLVVIEQLDRHNVDGFSASLHNVIVTPYICLLYTSPSPRDLSTSRMPSSA